MPEYVYECENCEHEFETIQSMMDDPLKKCPECKKHKLIRVIQPVHFGVRKHDSELSTLYDVGSRNRENMSREQRDKITADSKAKNRRARHELGKGQSYRDIPDQPKVDASLADLTPTQQKKYIETGQKPLKSDDTWHAFPSKQKEIKAEKRKNKKRRKK